MKRLLYPLYAKSFLLFAGKVKQRNCLFLKGFAGMIFGWSSLSAKPVFSLYHPRHPAFL